MGGLRLFGTDEVVDSHAAMLTGTVVALVLSTTLISNVMERFNTAHWISSDSILAIVLGFACSIPFCGWPQFEKVFTAEFDTVFFLYLLPPIIFESGYDLNQKDFFRNFLAIFLFAVCGTLISSCIMGASLFTLAQNGLISGLNATSPIEAMKFGSLMSATDPVATLAVLGSLNVEPQLYCLVFGESVLNDAVAIVLFQSFDLIPEMHELSITWLQAGKMLSTFISVSLGSILIGISFGVFAAIVTRKVLRDAHAHSEVTALLSTAYLSFIVSDACGFSGLMTIFFCGVMESHYAKYNISEAGRDTTANTSRVLAYVSETFVFIYFGFIILPTLAASCDHADSYVIDWPFVIWTVLLCIISRACNIVPLTLLLNLFKISPEAKKSRISMSSMLVIWFAGLRGAIAFALSLTFQGESRKYVIPCVVIIILFTNIVLGQGTAPLLHFLGIRMGVSPEPDDNDTRERAQQGGVGGTGPLGFARERFDSGSVSKRIIKRTSMLLSRGTLGDAPAHQVEDSVGVLMGGGHGGGGGSRRAIAINEFVHPRLDAEEGERERERGDVGVDADEPTDARRPHGAGEVRGAMMVVQTGSEGGGGGGGVHSVNSNSQAGDVESVGGSSSRSVNLGRRMGGGRSPGGFMVPSMSGGGGGGEGRGGLHRMWRRIDERYIKPVLGGRVRENASVPRGLAEYLLAAEGAGGGGEEALGGAQRGVENDGAYLERAEGGGSNVRGAGGGAGAAVGGVGMTV